MTDTTDESKPTKITMSDALVRQRRNLIITAVVAILLRYGGVEVSKVGALGTEFTINNKSAVYVGLWLTLGYFIVRYYQYLAMEVTHKLLSIYGYHFEMASYGIIRYLLMFRRFYMNRITYRHVDRPLHTIELPDGEIIPTDLRSATPLINNLAIFVHFRNKRTSNNILRTVSIPKWVKIPVHLIAILGIIFTRPIFTDLAFPFVLAAIAIVYGWDGDWTGSILHTTYVLLN